MSAIGGEGGMCKGPGEETAGRVQGTWGPVPQVVMWERGQHVGPNLMVTLGSLSCAEKCGATGAVQPLVFLPPM